MHHLVPRARIGASLMLTAAMIVASAVSANAVLFGGGGSSKYDCLLVLDTPVNNPVDNPKRIRCTDGDPACDADATVNGTCVFPSAVCANSSFNIA